ncbi:MAG TPA: 4Fe-4S binding protein [Candidatus Mediterraneibacter caccavium]|uniref:4Fe-4S binding protein n=1 Tax=Candidatus Mediterraneibacter caccavium TaxID=2838661 RepID=A0A9D1VXI6_9FIRM|nr:4Fe-4S binding protein [Candidatus Mediterraneibacter caccavium]
MIRKIIQIDEEKCNGCGACAEACHEGAIGMVNGKAKLLRDDYCDGLGDCLPTCPTGAISFVEREAAAYDEKAVQENMRRKNGQDLSYAPLGAGSQLGQWPCQIKLIPINAPWFDGARLLIAADCCAYAYARMHGDFMRGKITLIGCPKLDGIDYSEKLTQIIQDNNIQSVTIVRMEVPCCGGLESAAKRALQASGKSIPCEVATISVDGKILG